MAGRRLSPEEAALWQRVSGSVRALGGRQTVSPKTVRAELVEVPNFTSISAHKKDSSSTSSGRAVLRQVMPANTLDGSWDKRIGTGRVAPERTIDLHGYSTSAAHQHLDVGLDAAIRDGVRVILLVTGRAPRAGANRLDLPLRGIIRASVGDWLASSRHASAIAAVRNAHPRHGGSGALYIILRRARG